MGTTDIHEPEVKEVKPASRPSAAVLPKSDLTGSLPPGRCSPTAFWILGSRTNGSFRHDTSFVFNCLAIGVMLIMPLVFTESLPKGQLLTFLVAPPPPPPPPPPAAAVQKVVRQIQTDVLNTGQLRTPTRIPQKVQMIKEEEAPPPMPATGGVIGGVPGGIPGGQLSGVIGGIVNSTNLAVPKFVPVTPQRVRISQGVTKGL